MKKLKDRRPTKCPKCNTQLEYKVSPTQTIDYSAIRAKCKCGCLVEQNNTTNAVYIATDGNTFLHQGCGEEVDVVWRLHPVWDGPFACSGSGSVDRYPIPYCATHEEEPSSQGMPIQ